MSNTPNAANAWSKFRGKAIGTPSNPSSPSRDDMPPLPSMEASRASPVPGGGRGDAPHQTPTGSRSGNLTATSTRSETGTGAAWTKQLPPSMTPVSQPVDLSRGSEVKISKDINKLVAQKLISRAEKMAIGASPSKNVAAAATTSDRPLRIPELPNVREVGTTDVIANHFKVRFTKNFPKELYHYDVVIASLEAKGQVHATESMLPDRILPIIWRTFEETQKEILLASTPFDGKKNVYTAKMLNFDGQKGYSAILDMKDPDDPDKSRKFRVTIKLVGVIDTEPLVAYLNSQLTNTRVEHPQDVIQALDVALRYSPSIHFFVCNRSFFKPPSNERKIQLNNQLELWYGHYQSLCLGCDQTATLNIDLASKAFYSEVSLKTFLANVLGINEDEDFALSTWKDEDIRRVNEVLKGKLIEYGTGKFDQRTKKYENYHKFTAVGVVKESSKTYKFEVKEKGLISIAQYMKDVKKTDVLYPDYPVIHIGSQKMTNFVPLELCKIIPQAYRGKMEKELTSKMIKGAAVGPAQRFSRILNSRKESKFEQCPALAEFGIEVETKMTEISKSRYLLTPKINTRYRNKEDNGTKVNTREGKWAFKDRGDRGTDQRQFLEAVKVPKFAVMAIEQVHQQALSNFLDTLSKLGEAHGMINFIQQRKTVKLVQANQSGTCIRSTLKKLKDEGFELVIVILSEHTKEYATVKAEAEVTVGILTACIKRSNVEKAQNQTMVNYILKLHSKLNGVNWTVQHVNDMLKEPTIIFGADVTHPAPNSKAPSIAAVTASFSLSGMVYNMHIQPQDSRQEMIDGLAGIVAKMIKDFRKKTGKNPTRLIMFRDGVSEGFFNQIKAEEFEQIKAACKELNPNMETRITFIVVKKRHHTRLQPKNMEQDGVGNYKNVLPGTVVDTKIVHPIEQEFFLNSHVGIQGTSKPTRYHVIHDDNGFTMSQIQKLTYYLCYAFVRCTQPVSYPSATYYAHLAAYRARHLIEKEGENADLKSLKRQLTIHPDLLTKYPMFFV